MIAAIWSFVLGWVALLWAGASVFFPVRLTRTASGMEVDFSRTIVSVAPVSVLAVLVAGLSWHVIKHVKAPPEWKVSVSRGLGSSGLALSLIGLIIAISFSPIW